MSIPQDLFYDHTTPTCTVNLTALTTGKICQFITVTNDWGTTVTGIRIEMTDVCNPTTKVCPKDTSYIVSITGMRNKFLSSPTAGAITVSTMMVTTASNFYNVDVLDLEMTTNLASFSTLTPNIMTATAVRNETKVEEQSSINLNIVLPIRIFKESFINIFIPLKQFIPNGESLKYK
jgi:hypothetical protein